MVDEMIFVAGDAQFFVGDHVDRPNTVTRQIGGRGLGRDDPGAARPDPARGVRARIAAATPNRRPAAAVLRENDVVDL